MTLVLEMEIDGVPENVAALMIIARRAGNLEPALRKVIGVWEDIEQQVFSDGVLVDTGHLKESLTITGADGAVRDAHGTEIKFGTTVDYARATGRSSAWSSSGCRRT
jgi:hypothetical protein